MPGVEPGSNKVRAIAKFPRPKDVHGVRRLIGLLSFFRRFVPEFARIAAPLNKLTRAGEPFVWRGEHEKAYVKLRDALTSSSILRLYSPKAEKTELHTDASSEGLGAMLLQRERGEKLQLVYAISRRTSEVEARYHSSKLELLKFFFSILVVKLINFRGLVMLRESFHSSYSYTYM